MLGKHNSWLVTGLMTDRQTEIHTFSQSARLHRYAKEQTFMSTAGVTLITALHDPPVWVSPGDGSQAGFQPSTSLAHTHCRTQLTLQER